MMDSLGRVIGTDGLYRFLSQDEMTTLGYYGVVFDQEQRRNTKRAERDLVFRASLMLENPYITLGVAQQVKQKEGPCGSRVMSMYYPLYVQTLDLLARRLQHDPHLVLFQRSTAELVRITKIKVERHRRFEEARPTLDRLFELGQSIVAELPWQRKAAHREQRRRDSRRRLRRQIEKEERTYDPSDPGAAKPRAYPTKRIRRINEEGREYSDEAPDRTSSDEAVEPLSDTNEQDGGDEGRPGVGGGMKGKKPDRLT